MKITNPYRYIKQYTRLSIEAYHMNSDIRNNIKNLLKKKLEKKCNKNGYIDEIYRIIELSDGFMPPENLNGSAIYNITYHCKICIPIENTYLIGFIRVINNELIIALNGPIMFFIPRDNIDINIWNISNNYIHKLTNKKLSINDYVIIQVMDKRINYNDNQIKVIGKLIDIPSDEDIEKYYGNKIVKNKDPNSLQDLSDKQIYSEENIDNRDT
jgi:DNA-directed RNA polymerase subunit E'/Rpb7